MRVCLHKGLPTQEEEEEEKEEKETHPDLITWRFFSQAVLSVP